jgi:hypothetical protein
VTKLARHVPVGGDIAVVAAGGVRAILTSCRKPYHTIADFADLGLDPAAHDLTVVKVGYLVPELFAAAPRLGDRVDARRGRSGHRASRAPASRTADLSARSGDARSALRAEAAPERAFVDCERGRASTVSRLRASGPRPFRDHRKASAQRATRVRA